MGPYGDCSVCGEKCVIYSGERYVVCDTCYDNAVFSDVEGYTHG